MKLTNVPLKSDISPFVNLSIDNNGCFIIKVKRNYISEINMDHDAENKSFKVLLKGKYEENSDDIK